MSLLPPKPKQHLPPNLRLLSRHLCLTGATVWGIRSPDPCELPIAAPARRQNTQSLFFVWTDAAQVLRWMRRFCLLQHAGYAGWLSTKRKVWSGLDFYC